ANTSDSLLASIDIYAEDEGGILIRADELFLRETLFQVKAGQDQGSLLGWLSENKTKFTSIRSYPRNTSFVVEYVYDNPQATGPHIEYNSAAADEGQDDVAD